MNLLEEIKNKAAEGTPCSVDDAIKISEEYTLDEICDAADYVRKAHSGSVMDTCSIVNARSGRCTEDCNWCAQSRHFNTGCAEYESLPDNQIMELAQVNSSKGVRRFALVTSGRKVSKKDMETFVRTYRELGKNTELQLCASMGLLGKEELQMLKDAGVTRYHCNLETSSGYFGKLCTTHTHEDKLRTIRYALEVGMEVCSGGIIGMGETLRQRLEFAEESRLAGACSIPVNILNPIKGTPLENTPLISEKEVMLTIALMRLVAPASAIRFAGGRARLSEEATRRILHGGLSGCLVGDMLTTIGNNIDSDRELFTAEGFEWKPNKEK